MLSNRPPPPLEHPMVHVCDSDPRFGSLALMVHSVGIVFVTVKQGAMDKVSGLGDDSWYDKFW